MLYLHDVWTNWVSGMGKAHHVIAFHEWDKTDGVELTDQTPLLYVTKELMDFIENGCGELPKEMLEAIEDRSYIRKNHDRIQVKYAAVITDGIRVMAFDTVESVVPTKKSRLIPRQEQLVYEMIAGTEEYDYGFNPEDHEVDMSGEVTVGAQILDIKDVHMIGLTRRERDMKEILMNCLFELVCSENINEVRYWYTELFPGSMVDIMEEEMTIEDMVADMHDHLSEGWDEQHVNFGHKFVPYYDLYTEDWKHLHKLRAGGPRGEAV